MDARLVFILAALGIVAVESKLINSCNLPKIFVDGHNERRLQLARGEVPGQPAASNMTYLIWDEDLANKAMNWASRNKYGHSKDRTIPGKFQYVGENIYRVMTTDKNFRLDPEMAMKSWWDEYKIYKYGKLRESQFGKSSRKIGHYTQMAWADTVRIGCGVSHYNENGWKCWYVVCNYGPGGNFIGQTPYKSGHASGRLVCGDPDSDCRQKYGNKCERRTFWK